MYEICVEGPLCRACLQLEILSKGETRTLNFIVIVDIRVTSNIKLVF